jgi:hypothetical protein
MTGKTPNTNERVEEAILNTVYKNGIEEWEKELGLVFSQEPRLKLSSIPENFKKSFAAFKEFQEILLINEFTPPFSLYSIKYSIIGDPLIKPKRFEFYAKPEFGGKDVKDIQVYTVYKLNQKYEHTGIAYLMLRSDFRAINVFLNGLSICRDSEEVRIEKDSVMEGYSSLVYKNANASVARAIKYNTFLAVALDKLVLDEFEQ